MILFARKTLYVGGARVSVLRSCAQLAGSIYMPLGWHLRTNQTKKSPTRLRNSFSWPTFENSRCALFASANRGQTSIINLPSLTANFPCLFIPLLSRNHRPSFRSHPIRSNLSITSWHDRGSVRRRRTTRSSTLHPDRRTSMWRASQAPLAVA